MRDANEERAHVNDTVAYDDGKLRFCGVVVLSDNCSVHVISDNHLYAIQSDDEHLRLIKRAGEILEV